jgi:hypothetical protein
MGSDVTLFHGIDQFDSQLGLGFGFQSIPSEAEQFGKSLKVRFAFLRMLLTGNTNLSGRISGRISGGFRPSKTSVLQVETLCLLVVAVVDAVVEPINAIPCCDGCGDQSNGQDMTLLDVVPVSIHTVDMLSTKMVDEGAINNPNPEPMAVVGTYLLQTPLLNLISTPRRGSDRLVETALGGTIDQTI